MGVQKQSQGRSPRNAAAISSGSGASKSGRTRIFPFRLPGRRRLIPPKATKARIRGKIHFFRKKTNPASCCPRGGVAREGEERTLLAFQILNDYHSQHDSTEIPSPSPGRSGRESAKDASGGSGFRIPADGEDHPGSKPLVLR